jgi:hypothetical protein
MSITWLLMYPEAADRAQVFVNVVVSVQYQVSVFVFYLEQLLLYRP